jgi:hypothetical protein
VYQGGGGKGAVAPLVSAWVNSVSVGAQGFQRRKTLGGVVCLIQKPSG